MDACLSGINLLLADPPRLEASKELPFPSEWAMLKRHASGEAI
jgi:hypothetical protein